MPAQLTPDDALLVIDMQNDFMAGGNLAVAGAAELLGPINDCIQSFKAAGLPVFASRDYHPADHLSFREAGGQWPRHCVAGSRGAEFHQDLALPPDAIIISKATSREREAYSAMDGTELPSLLVAHRVRRLFVCGLATEYCVLASVRDLLAAGYLVTLLSDGIRAVNMQPGDGDRALTAMADLGADLISWHR